MIWGQKRVGVGVFLGQLRADLIWAVSNLRVPPRSLWLLVQPVSRIRPFIRGQPVYRTHFLFLCLHGCVHISLDFVMVILTVIQCFSKMVCLIPLNKFPAAKIQQIFCWQVFCGFSFPASEEEGNNQASNLVLRSQQILGRFASCTAALREYKCKPLTRDETKNLLFHFISYKLKFINAFVVSLQVHQHI